MAWSYLVPPDIAVSIKARKKPALLSHCLGEEVPVEGEPAIDLDLAPRADRPSGPDGRSLALRGVYKAVPWRCRMARAGEGAWKLQFSSPLLREYLALHVVLLPVLRRLFLSRGVALVLGGAFEQDGAATLLAGPTGRGKTTLLLGALERGARFLGDEYLGLAQDGTLTPLIRSFALRRATFALAPGALERLSPGRRLALRASEVVAALTRGILQPLVHAAPSELGTGGEASPGARVGRLFWLQGEASAGAGVRCERMEAAEAVRELAFMQSIHDLAYGDIGAFLEPNEPGYATRWRAVVESALSDVACYRLIAPASNDAWPELLETIVARN